MEIEIKYCNNIDSAVITLHEKKLNIKFASNGTGKSTIAKAIEYRVKEDQAQLNGLLPFKFRRLESKGKKPEIIGVDSIKSIMCFNEEYINQFVFKQDELVSNSFDIFIRTEVYRENEKKIENLVQEIKKVFSNNNELESLIAKLNEMSNAFRLTATGLSKASSGMKGLSGGNKLQHIPRGLEPFQAFIRSQNPVAWIDWQTKGYEFSKVGDDCPFCASSILDKKTQIEQVGQEYDKNIIKNLVSIVDIIYKLGDYFSPSAASTLKDITELTDGLGKEHEAFMVTIKIQIDSLIKKLETLRTLSAFHFNEGDEISEKLSSYKVDLQYSPGLSSDKTQKLISPVNESIDILAKKAEQLQGIIKSQRREMQKNIEKYQGEINDFLSYAGYKYKVELSSESEKSQLKLLHIDHDQHLSGGNQHLSFGERNAFSIVLFMYECLAKNPDLIILDDPISSFDKHKKYAILEMLFRRDAKLCLKGRTVIFFTHDIEPIIDMIKSLHDKFYNTTTASFLKVIDSKIEEKLIKKDNIKTFFQICESIFTSEVDEVIKLIYLRRYYEIYDSQGDVYQIISSLFHKRERATDNRREKNSDGEYPFLEKENFDNGSKDIQKILVDFSYDASLNKIRDKDALRLTYNASKNGYERLQIFRLLGFDSINSVIQKFMNETYHIENEFICQLDPAQFDTIPEYVINECNNIIHAGEQL